MQLTKRALFKMTAATALFAAIAAPAAAEFSPVKPIDFIIMSGAGGGADQIARFLQSVAEKENLTTRPLIPNNMGGGSGAEALIELSGASDPDYSILVTLNSFFTTPLRQAGLGIDTKSFTPVAMMGVDPFVLWVHKDAGITTFDQWLETVRGMNGEYVMGGTGTGQEDSLVVTHLQNAFDLKIKYIPFDGGGAVAKELAGQQIMATVNNPAEARGFFLSGDVIPLVTFSDERLPAFPDVPTLKELGNDFSYYNQRAVVGAPGMSDDAAAYYQKLFETIYNTPAWQGYMESESLSPLWMTPEETRTYWDQQIQRHTELLAEMEG